MQRPACEMNTKEGKTRRVDRLLEAFKRQKEAILWLLLEAGVRPADKLLLKTLEAACSQHAAARGIPFKGLRSRPVKSALRKRR
jgi:hypothetical protein